MNNDIEALLNDSEVTEIVLNGPGKIFYEQHGKLLAYGEGLTQELEYSQFVRSVLEALNSDLSMHEPFCTGRIGDFRVQVVGAPVVSVTAVSFRRISQKNWDLSKWTELGGPEHQMLQSLIHKKKNILVFGSTGSGKTTLLSALLKEVSDFERVVLLEDIEELSLPNASSLRLLSRANPTGVLKEITLSDLVRHSLRLRPDRLALGEVRGPEAKDLLMALATGHRGSLGTIHANSLNEALLRLEMLVQLGAPQWQTKSIRQLIFSGVNIVIGVERKAGGERAVSGIYQISGLEEFGFLTEKIH